MTTTKELVELIEGHGIPASVAADGQISTVSQHTKDGVYGEEPVTLKPDLDVVMDWLGY